MAPAQQVIPLYQNEIPNALPSKIKEQVIIETDGKMRISKVSVPTITLYLPPAGKANGTAVVICPGGSYQRLSIENEGSLVARRLNEMGVAGIVLKYRLPNDSLMQNKEIVPLQDAQRALQLVRENATAWKIDPNRVGIMGFSAGGHLASTAGTHFRKAYIDNKDSVNLRPDFMVLLYPVISFTDNLAHMSSRTNLVGKNPTAATIAEYSNELRVTKQTPPAFLVHAGDDATVKVQNSLAFYDALQKNKVPAEMHIYPNGGHGFALHNKTTKDDWVERLENWLDINGWLKK